MKNAVFWDVASCGSIPEGGILQTRRFENLKSFIEK
jgi:hypothetical protein